MIRKISKALGSLTIDTLNRFLKEEFSKFEDTRADNSHLKLSDGLMSGYAMFSLKDASMLHFNNERSSRSGNLKSIYHVEKAPSDTGMRTILDEVNPSQFFKVFTGLIKKVRAAGIFKAYRYFKGYIIVSLDGVHHFSSYCVKCKHCLEYNVNGKIQYRHYTLSGAVVHPDKKAVLPVLHEPILKQDGKKKNDCEQNAAKRFFPKLKKQFPTEKVVIVQDSIGSTGPNIKAIKEEGFTYILSVKPDGHETLFKQYEGRAKRGAVKTYEVERDGFIHKFFYINNLCLNETHPDIRVNFLDYYQIDKTGKKPERHFTWITEFNLNKSSVFKVMRAGRSRWKIENETFNTLKNQGYHFEHNFGHGRNHLNVVLMYLMMLAFFVDQLQQDWNENFKAAWHKQQTKISLWGKVRQKFDEFEVPSMDFIYQLIIGNIIVEYKYANRDGTSPFKNTKPKRVSPLIDSS